jgi:hypothetical protein
MKDFRMKVILMAGKGVVADATSYLANAKVVGTVS